MIFSQDFNDKIVTWTGDTINCEINLVNDYDIFYHFKEKNNIRRESIPINKVRNYILAKTSQPEIVSTKKRDTTITAVKYDSLMLAKKNAENSVTYKNGFAINLEAFLVEDFKLSYTHRINKGCYFESMISYNIPEKKFLDGNYNCENYLYQLKDPYGLYGRVQIRIGIKEYTTKRFYVSPNLLYSYGSFYKKENIIYEPGKNYYEVSRFKNDFEFFFKFGWTFLKAGILNDFYMGVGFRAKYLNDEIYQGAIGSGNYMPVVPYNKKTSYGILTLHLGYQIGYCK